MTEWKTIREDRHVQSAMQEETHERNVPWIPIGISVGMSLGAVFGCIFGRLSLGIVLGGCIGAVLGLFLLERDEQS